MSNLGSDPVPDDRIDEFVRQFEGGKSIKRVLIANNGLSAMKCLISIRQWLQNQFVTSDVVSFVCIATEDEMKSASHYLKLADEIIMAPAGTNSKNFANVDVIVSLAQKSRVDAVYVGWGHASENPELCRRLRKADIIFIGPSEKSIVASGDKIISTIIAQSIGMPTVTWSGSDVKVNKCVDFEHFHELRAQATIKTVKEGLEAIEKYRIGVPMMIKASEGGGGKGIRKCERMDDFERFFKEVEMEVPNSPIFLMKCMEGARHVEIQIIGDKHGEVIALSSRDCTIQRRCQKVIEEAPASIVPEEIMKKMKEDAIAFANFVDYYSAGTVELLFVPSTNQYFFLELNPRLQVEHPCTESVCDVNVPALQFQIAMGRALKDIPCVRRFKEREAKGENGKMHCMAARVTCEDPNDRFLPSTGIVRSLKFNSTSKAWAYFSLSDGSTVHEFADSQIGHVFARGRDRSEAITNLKHALHNLKIDATFPTQSDYLIDLLSLEKFKSNQYDTQWLDQRIAQKEQQFFQKLTLPIDHLIAISSAAIGRSKIRGIFEKYENQLRSGKIVLPVELSRSTEVELQFNNIKYLIYVYEETPFKYHLRIGDFQQTTVEMLKYGSQNLAIHQGKSTDYVLEETEEFYFIKIGGNKLKFSKMDTNDPSCLRSPYTGKFLEYKVQSGEFLEIGQTYAQIESMKMVFDVVTKVAPGRLIPIAKEGDLINPGTILGRLEIDKAIQDQLTTSEKFDGEMKGWKQEEKTDFEKAQLILEGRGPMDYPIDSLVNGLFDPKNSESHDETRDKISELIQFFMETDQFFDSRNGFDESVQQLLEKESDDYERIVDLIHSNTQLKIKENLILTILGRIIESGLYFGEILADLLKYSQMKQLKSISSLTARVIYRYFRKLDYSTADCKVDIQKSSFSPNVASMRFKNDNLFTTSSEFSSVIDGALLEFECFSSQFKNIQFVANRIELSIDFSITDAEKIISENQKRLEEAGVKEIILLTESSESYRLYLEIEGLISKSTVIPEFVGPERRDSKRHIARQNRTTYIYDFPRLFCHVAAPDSDSGDSGSKNPMEIQELVIDENQQLQQIFDPEELEKRAVHGLNSCSVVAWLINLKIGDDLREFVLIGNDVTHQVGSFAQPEHELFEMASKLARERKIPRINISCNSGARIGLARDVLDILKVKLKPNGHDFDYLYIDATEKERIGDQIVYEQHGDELKLIAVKGKKNEFIGVENLMGSGAIGGETSRAYREIPTYCYVTGRSVGIGAYTARLARRIIQHKRSQLILTGATALNTLLGKKVYASNNRLGGVEIMANNGIAHSVVDSDMGGVEKLIKWLSYLPVKQKMFPFFKCFENTPEDVKLEDVTVGKDEMQTDVRRVIEGFEGRQGIFDSESFDEICTSWAASIVTGRATLNGLPVGVIASQWKSYEKRQLADESVEKSEETIVARAGQVWYPESAFKTSQAISDFNRESLPLVMIASLRGFSGGRKDMSDQVLTFGAHIIDELSQYQQPVIVYIPAGGELRGGAWAVVDSNVNRGFVHVIADESCRGGILEPNAVVGIKIRDAPLAKIMERSGVAPDGVEDSVKSAFKKACVDFADMHDRWQRMEHVGAIRHVTNLQNTRDVFWRLLRREMILIEMATQFRSAPIHPKPTNTEALEWVKRKIGDDVDLQKYFNDGFYDDVTQEIQESRRRFEKECSTWQQK